MKQFRVIILYQTKEKLVQYLRELDDSKIKVKAYKTSSEIYLENEDVVVRCFRGPIPQNIRGVACDMVAVERAIYEEENYYKDYLPTIDRTLAKGGFDRFGRNIVVF